MTIENSNKTNINVNQKIIDQIHSYLKGKEHIIWDWNGTLLSDLDHAIQVLNKLLVKYELPQVTKEYYRQNFKFPVYDFYVELGFEFKNISFENLSHEFVDEFMKSVTDLPLIPEMKLVLETLHNEGIKQSVLSASDQQSLDFLIDHFQLRSVFDYVYGINNKMASSKVYRGHELIKDSKSELQKTVLIGDTLHDLEVAKELGIDAILISHGHQCDTRLTKVHDKVVVV